jgi:hypothetical protein
MKLTDHVTLNFNNNMSTASVSWISKKPLLHTGLQYKLTKLDFLVSLIKLISFLLYKRKFFVLVEGEMSTPRIMKAGVPQGSVLSPTLFNMYVNDSPRAIAVHLALFAEDTCLNVTERKEGYVLCLFLHRMGGISHVKYLGVIFDKKITWRSHIEMIEAKAFRAFITTYSLFKSQ